VLNVPVAHQLEGGGTGLGCGCLDLHMPPTADTQGHHIDNRITLQLLQNAIFCAAVWLGCACCQLLMGCPGLCFNPTSCRQHSSQEAPA
jgi:hypothetical protein